MALANSFIKKEDVDLDEFACPLNVCRCTNCGLVQLSHVVSPNLMFDHYLYVSSTSATFRKHFAEYAIDVKARFEADTKLLAVDIGSNDGLLLSCFENIGVQAVGIEPATNLSDEANAKGLVTLNQYFNNDAVKSIVDQFGKADIITANNVFAHIDNIVEVCECVSTLLDDDGIFITEFPYLVTMYENMLFDMIYHEHLSFISLTPLKSMLAKFDLVIVDVKEVESHGGSLRVYIQNKKYASNASEIVEQLLIKEEKAGYNQQGKHDKFAIDVALVKDELISFIEDAKKNGKSICGYGAPAKGNTLINYCSLTSSQIDFIVDDSPLKQNLLTPGANIPVVSSSYLENNPTDYVVVFAWNFAKEIIGKMSHLREKGVKFIVPLPKPKII